MIDLMKAGSQGKSAIGAWVRRVPILARIKGFANGVNPRWGTRTVVVSDRTGDIIRLESRDKPGIEFVGQPRRPKRARIFL